MFRGIVNGLMEPLLTISCEDEKLVILAYANDTEYLVEGTLAREFPEWNTRKGHMKIIEYVIKKAQKQNMKKLERYMKILQKDLEEI